jgi:hypothetical protein
LRNPKIPPPELCAAYKCEKSVEHAGASSDTGRQNLTGMIKKAHETEVSIAESMSCVL